MVDIFDDFTRWMRTRDLSPGSIECYQRVAHLLARFVECNYGQKFTINDLASIKGYMVSNWASSISDLKVATRYHYIVAARIFLGFLYAMQYTAFDLRQALPEPPDIDAYNRLHPDTYSPKRDYTPSEISAMLNSVNPNCLNGARTTAIICLLVTTGLRVSELASLNVGDLRHCTGTFSVPRKGTHGLKVPVNVPMEILPCVKRYVQYRENGSAAVPDDAPLFSTRTGRRMSRREIYGVLQAIQKRLDIPTGVHTFRHTALTQTAKASDPIVARDIAGQKSVNVTNRYLHSSAQEQAQAVRKLMELIPAHTIPTGKEEI